MSFASIDWASLFAPTMDLIEIALRGSLVYLLLFGILRLFRRRAGAIGIADLLVVVLIADAAQNAMGSEYKSITEGFILVATIALWDHALDWLGHRFPRFERLVRPAPLPLIQGGKLMRRNLRQELVTEEELMTQLREQGVESVGEVKLCCLEGDGHFSVIKRETESAPSVTKSKSGPTSTRRGWRKSKKTTKRDNDGQTGPPEKTPGA